MNRRDGRTADMLRPVEIIPNTNAFAEGSCIVKCGATMVYITASVEDRVPPHVAEGCGWVTAEYNMLPRANRTRSRRDVTRLKLSGRSAEIQRLIGRSLRAAVDMQKLGPRCITVDCDVLQGGRGHTHRLRHRRLGGAEAGLPKAAGGRAAGRGPGGASGGGGVRRTGGGGSPAGFAVL